jgi:cytochrome c oxidase subunit 3
MTHAEAHAADAHGSLDHDAFERARMGMWLFLGSEIMMFGAFIAVYTVLRMATPHDVIADSKMELSWVIALINTAVLILSSYTMVRAVNAISRDDKKHCNQMLIATGLLGLAFLVIKIFFEYTVKFGHHIYPDTNVFFSCYFLLTGFHGFHVLVGVVILLALPCYVNKLFGAHRYAFIENTALYWHFVDLVWIFLFPILYLL